MSAISLDEIQASFHSIAIENAAGDALLIDASGHLSINDGGNVISIDDAGGAISIDDNGGSITVDGAVTVSATDLDIRDLTHVSDSVKVGDGTDFLAVNADGSINVNATEGAFDTWKVTAQSVTSTATELAATPLASRLRIVLQNLGSQDAFLGEDSGVVIGDGLKLPKASSIELNLSAVANIFAITASSTADFRIAEFAL